MKDTLEEWLLARIADDTGHKLIDRETPLYRYGVDSRTLAFIVDGAEQAFALSADLDRISPAETVSALVVAFAPSSEAGRA